MSQPLLQTPAQSQSVSRRVAPSSSRLADALPRLRQLLLMRNPSDLDSPTTASAPRPTSEHAATGAREVGAPRHADSNPHLDHGSTSCAGAVPPLPRTRRPLRHNLSAVDVSAVHHLAPHARPHLHDSQDGRGGVHSGGVALEWSNDGCFLDSRAHPSKAHSEAAAHDATTASSLTSHTTSPDAPAPLSPTCALLPATAAATGQRPQRAARAASAAAPTAVLQCPALSSPGSRTFSITPPAAAAAAAAGVASSSTSHLLSVSSELPLLMQRPVWSVREYSITTKVHQANASGVYKATCLLSGVPVILKVYDLQRVPRNVIHTLVREVRIHSQLAHRSIIGLYGAFQEKNRLVLVQERAHRGDLYRVHRELMGSRMSEAQLAVVVLGPLLDALAYMHAKALCHRDIKPENLLLCSDWSLKLADFGAAINLAEERAVTRTGTEDYMAPEVTRCPVKARPEDNKDDASLAYTTAADIWSVGVLAFEMLVGFPPFSSANPYRADARTSGAPLDNHVSFPGFVSPGARDFISCALAPRPGDRPTAAQLLRHPWLKMQAMQAGAAARAAA